MEKKGAVQLKKFYAFLSSIIIAFILILNSVSITVDIPADITAAISEPLGLLLFGSVLIGLANVGRKKVFKKENGLEHLDMPGRADSLEENDNLEGWYAGKQVSAGLGNK